MLVAGALYWILGYKWRFPIGYGGKVEQKREGALGSANGNSQHREDEVSSNEYQVSNRPDPGRSEWLGRIKVC